jgi:2-polyprenyl-6-methoxyphenol hydroxylase-like FAD-dependent oxidoreductase
MGRRSPLPKLLEAAGCAAPYEEAEDCGFSYYSRFFRSTDGTMPESYGPLLTPMGSFSILTLPSDDETWSVTLFVASGDQPLKRFRFADTFESVVRACPAHAQWLNGEAITEMDSMGGLIDRYRRLVVDGQPVATGVVSVADAWACTNPSLGRGITLGLAHAVGLRDVASAELGDPLGFAQAFDELTEREHTPWYRATVAVDRARIAEMEAIRNGLEPPGPANFEAGLGPALDAAAPHDADVFRAMLEIVGCHTLPSEVFARPGMVERVVELAEEHPPVVWPAPSREELLQLVAEQPAGA